jgi:hypothetical protein
MRYGTPADEERLLNEIRERAKNPARLDPRAERIAEGALTALIFSVQPAIVGKRGARTVTRSL